MWGWRRRSDEDFREEIRVNIALETDRLIAEGMNPEEAKRTALRAFGNVTRTQERFYESSRVGWLDHLARDTRYAVRTLVKSPAFAAIVILTLALGIGANTAIFSVAHAVLFQPLPYPEASRLVAVVPSPKDQSAQTENISYLTFQDWQRDSRSFDSLGAYVVAGSTLTGRGEATQPTTAAITPNLFSLLGMGPLLGRTLVADDGAPRGERVVVISESLWRAQFGQNAQIVGQQAVLDGAPFTVVGVMPAAFRFPHVNPPPDIWMPLTQFEPFQQLLPIREAPMLSLVGRLRSGLDAAAAESELRVLAAQQAAQYPGRLREQIISVRDLQNHVVGETRASLLMLLGAVGLLLLIACTNIAGLQVARSVGRVREMSIRAALGAGKGTLFRQLLVESLVLSVAGGALGVLLAHNGLQLFAEPIARDLPQIRDVRVDGWMLGIAFALSCVTGVIFGAIPVVGAKWVDLGERLKAETRSTTDDRSRVRAQGALVMLEVALALVMLTSAGLLIRSLVHLRQVDPGFGADRLLTATINLPQSEYSRPQQWVSFNEELLQRIQRLPGVEAAAFGVGVPFLGVPFSVPVAIEGHSPPAGVEPRAEMAEASADYFSTLKLPLLQGRAFTDSDTRQSARVAVVNRTFVRRFFGDQEAIGSFVLFGQGTPVRAQIVGVVGDSVQASVVAPPPPLFYLPFAQRPFWITSFVIRTAVNPSSLASTVRREVTAMAPTVPVLGIETMETLLQRSFAESSYRTLLLGLLSLLALILAAVGLYGLLAYTVSRRTHEIGIRMALGADRALVLRFVLGHGVRLTLLGVAIGLALSVATTRFLTTLLFNVSATDPLTLGGTSALLLFVAILACWIPSRRATRVDPLVALRCE